MHDKTDTRPASLQRSAEAWSARGSGSATSWASTLPRRTTVLRLGLHRAEAGPAFVGGLETPPARLFGDLETLLGPSCPAG
ncbi:hypothetical protein [Streptomyces californicus]|uniref:hypothetical protein n=1 Tax=Streptomyces californicus TaxID=67351 RepID=UPI003789DAF3